MTYHDAMRAYARQLLTAALEEHGGNRARTARALDVSRQTVYDLIREHGIDVPAPTRGRPRTETAHA